MSDIVKRGRGRPKGSKNKVKPEVVTDKCSCNTVAPCCKDVKIDESKEGKKE